MDAETKEVLRWKFYRLALQLNAVVLFVALTIIALFMVPEPFRIPLVLLLLLLIPYLSIDFYKKYHATKLWLDEQADKEKLP
jgi:chromate transport protein ChrA